jgi:2',3'-cyclic-nucleotide 2'-phosphodiesterase
MNSIRVLMLGDIVGAPGRAVLQKHLGVLCAKYAIDVVALNGENSAHGLGITPQMVQFFRECGVRLITSGNHIWHRKEIIPYISSAHDLLRPANYPSGTPGTGVATFLVNNQLVAFINLQGRVFMREHIECPFRTAETLLAYLRDKTKIICVDFHAEATSEKQALAAYLDGKVSAVCGTHTHVQTADEMVLPGGTGYISDLGMAGALHSLLGMEPAPVIQKFLTQMPARFTVALNPPYCLQGAIITINADAGHALAIERINLIDNDIEAISQGKEHALGGW